MSTDIRNDPLWKNSDANMSEVRARWVATWLDNTGELTARGVLFLFGACTVMVCYVMSCFLG